MYPIGYIFPGPVIIVFDEREVYTLCGAILRGIAANCNEVDFAFLALDLKVDRIKSQLPQQCWERFEVDNIDTTWIQLKLHAPTGEVVCVLYQSLCTVSIFSSSSCCRQ